jgi:hypothetical protein
MASLYQRKNSPYWWIKYKGPEGLIHRESTCLRIEDLGESRKARALKMEKSIAEIRSPNLIGKHLTDWVPLWIDSTKNGKTAEKYLQVWRVFTNFFNERGIVVAPQITRELCIEYYYRRQVGLSGLGKCSATTALFDLRILRAILFEALKRGHVQQNVASRLGIKIPRMKERAELSTQDIELNLFTPVYPSSQISIHSLTFLLCI